MNPDFDAAILATQYEGRPPQEVLRLALEHFDNVAISFSGAEDVVLIDMAVKIKPDIGIFSLDTGRLHAETYRFLEQVREHYDIDIELQVPDADELRRLTREKGLFSFYRDGHQECCGVRKVMPLRRKLAELDAWITGQRRDQSPGTRAEVPVVQLDNAFSTPQHTIYKFNPLTHWTSAEVWSYIRTHALPYNELHERGYISIGCEPCTRPVLPGQHEREGRWWWEEQTRKECGLHAVNLEAKTGTD